MFTVFVSAAITCFVVGKHQIMTERWRSWGGAEEEVRGSSDVLRLDVSVCSFFHNRADKSERRGRGAKSQQEEGARQWGGRIKRKQWGGGRGRRVMLHFITVSAALPAGRRSAEGGGAGGSSTSVSSAHLSVGRMVLLWRLLFQFVSLNVTNEHNNMNIRDYLFFTLFISNNLIYLSANKQNNMFQFELIKLWTESEELCHYFKWWASSLLYVSV